MALVQIAFSAILFTNFSALNIRKWPKTRYPNRLHFSVYIGVFTICSRTFSRTAWLLEALLIREFPVGALANGFLVGPAADHPLDEVPTEPAIASVPICLNWKDVGIVIWLECEADGYRVKLDTSRRYKPRPLAVPAIFDRGVRRSSTL